MDRLVSANARLRGVSFYRLLWGIISRLLQQKWNGICTHVSLLIPRSFYLIFFLHFSFCVAEINFTLAVWYKWKSYYATHLFMWHNEHSREVGTDVMSEQSYQEHQHVRRDCVRGSASSWRVTGVETPVPVSSICAIYPTVTHRKSGFVQHYVVYTKSK